ncbi:MAG TPA: AI-2E family transporter [Chitinophagaceae bacterium]|nr:AI-2E family transporter [Chitinophagaceae bacterium]
MPATTSRGNTTNTLITITLILLLLYWGQAILKPLAFAGLLAVLLISPSRMFEKAGFSRGIAALISVLLAFVVFFVVFYFLSTSIISFKQDLPLLLKRLGEAMKELEVWAQQKFNISTQKMQEFVDSSTNDALPSTSSIVNTTLNTVSSGIFLTIIIFIYTFLLLLYRGLIVRFLISMMAQEHTEKIRTVLSKIRYVIKGYIVGLFIETAVVAAMNAAAFFILGVRYALLLAVISALFNIIPYLGIFMACVLSTLITFTTDSTSTVVGVIVSLIIIHMIDSNILMPKIVGSKVKMNALATIVGVITVSALWGIPGTFLAVPILAVLKVIFEEIESMKPYALVMGDDEEVKSASKPVIKRLTNTVRKRTGLKET